MRARSGFKSQSRRGILPWYLKVNRQMSTNNNLEKEIRSRVGRTLSNLHRRWWILKLTIARWGIMIGDHIENNTLRATHIKSKEISRRHVTGCVILFATTRLLFIYMFIFSKMKSRWKIKSRPQNSKDKAQIALEKTSLLQHRQTNSVESSSTQWAFCILLPHHWATT